MYQLMFLTKESGLILGPISKVLGYILDAIYRFLALFSKDHTANIALCIILFTIIVKMLMIPLIIKQQKATKLTARMQPELTAISEKYKGKRDEVSQRMMTMETQAVYQKYGSSPFAGCLPLLITLPIMFALYRVIYAIPAYIGKIYEMYQKVANSVFGINGYAAKISEFVTNSKIQINVSKFSEFSGNTISEKHLVDIFSKFTEANWKDFANFLPEISEDITNLSAPIIKINRLGAGLNILNTPISEGFFTIGLLIPILAVVTQIIQTKMTPQPENSNNNKNKPDDAVTSSLKTMTVVMPIFSGFICLMIPIGVGIYWIMSSVVQIIQQFFINRYMNKLDVDEMIAKNQEKAAKKRAKYGIATGNKMAEVAKTSTKSISTAGPKSTSDYARLGGGSNNQVKKNNNISNSGVVDSSKRTGGSISDYANILKDRNDK